MTADIIAMPTAKSALADRIRGAYERTERGRHDWIGGTLELAAALAEARALFPADRQFSVWLADNDLDRLGYNDRAALITMGQEPSILREVLTEQSEQYLPNTVWQKARGRFQIHLKPEQVSEIAANPTSEPPREPTQPSETAPPPVSNKATLRKTSVFYGWPRGDEVMALFGESNTRSVIGRAINQRGGKEIWPLILAAIDAGFLTVNTISCATASLRLLFPTGPKVFCGRFDLADAKQRARVRDEILPAALANRAAILAAPDQLEDIIAAHRQRQQEAAREAAARQKVEEARRAMLPDQQEIIIFGQRLWPRVEPQFGTYEYDQLRAAIWYFRDLDGWVEGGRSGNSPKSRAIIIRLSTRWLQEYADRDLASDDRLKIKKVYQLVGTLAGLLEKNPGGECAWPPTPKIEGQW